MTEKDLGGRPSKFTKERCDAIVFDILRYVPYEFAAMANGISERTLHGWLEKGREDLDKDIDSIWSRFLQDVKRAERDRIVDNAEMIHDREKDWQAKGWLLERRHWKHFSNNAPLVELNRRLDELEKGKNNG